MRICNPPQARMLREDMKSLRLRIAKKRKKKEKHPFISLKKQEKQEKYHKMMRKVKKNLAVTGKKSTFAAVIKLLGINMMQNSNHSV